MGDAIFTEKGKGVLRSDFYLCTMLALQIGGMEKDECVWDKTEEFSSTEREFFFKTFARLLSATPFAAKGPCQIVMFDIHALQERFYFSDNVIPRYVTLFTSYRHVSNVYLSLLCLALSHILNFELELETGP